MNFQNHYFKEEEQITEVNWLKSRFLGNAFKKLIGSGKRRINPADFKNMTQLTGGGFAEMFGVLDNRYTNQKKLKNYIKDLKTAEFNPKDAEGVFKTKQGPIDIQDKKQIKSASYYVTNKGGRIALFNIADASNNDTFFIGLDGNAIKFFNAPLKKGGIGKDFKTWLSVQAAKTYKPNSKVMSPDFGGTENEKDLTPHKYEIDDKEFDQLAPDEGETFHRFKLAASNQSFSLLDMFTEEVLGEKVVKVLKKGDKWVTAANDLEVTQKLIDKNKDLEYRAFEKADSPQFDNLLDKEFKQDMKKVKEEPKEEPKDEETAKDGETSDEKDAKNIEDQKAEIKKNKEEYDKTDVKEFGELALDLKDELLRPPNKVKSTDKMKYGWRYLTKNGGTIFVYQGTDGKNYIKYDDKAQDVIKSKNLIPKYGMTKAVTPE